MRVLLTGGTGMVGRNILDQAPADLEIVAPPSTRLDLRDFSSVRAFLSEVAPDVVVHAAGRVGGIHANMRKPASFLVDNWDMGRNLLIAAHEAGVRRILNLGSSCMYPRGRSTPLTEDLVLKGELEPTNEGYALAKIAIARLGEYLAREDAGFQCKTLIPCNLYGRYDKFDPAHSHLVPAILHKLHTAVATGQNTVDIWGDGSARREFMYAADLADAVLAAIRDFDEIPTYMNLGLGGDLSIREYYEAAAKVVGFTGEFLYDLTKPVGMARKLVDVSRQKAWGWHPKHDLATGLRLTYDFYLKTQR